MRLPVNICAKSKKLRPALDSSSTYGLKSQNKNITQLYLSVSSSMHFLKGQFHLLDIFVERLYNETMKLSPPKKHNDGPSKKFSSRFFEGPKIRNNTF
jgi:hypothetical protein